MPLLAINPIHIQIFWVVVIILMLIVEFFTEDFTSLWFSFGGAVSLVMSLLGVDSFLLQFGVFLAVSIILLLSLRKVMKKVLIKKYATNIDAMIGKEVLVLTGCDSFNRGEGKVDGLIWTIISENNEKIIPNDIVVIKKIEGNKLIVTKK
ncbi:MAG: NfeD family protein [Bacilli bacterium]|nr:NfeD family protein [Bacilli bacterium]